MTYVVDDTRTTLYEKLSVPELKKCLHAAFSQFGKILDIVCAKTYRLRGQAWVVFEDVTSATKALTLMQGFPFYEKPMRIAYAKSKSDVVAKSDGTYAPRDRAEAARKDREKRDAMIKNAAARKGVPTSNQQQAPMSGGAMGGAQMGVDAEPPHNILFVQNLPPQANTAMIQMLFEQFPGFKEVRMIESRPGIAFVEFGNEMESSVALTGLQGFKITEQNKIIVSYSKK